MAIPYYTFPHILLIFAADPAAGGACTDDDDCVDPQTCVSSICSTYIYVNFRSSQKQFICILSMTVSYYELYHTLLIFAADPPAASCNTDADCTNSQTCQSGSCGT